MSITKGTKSKFWGGAKTGVFWFGLLVCVSAYGAFTNGDGGAAIGLAAFGVILIGVALNIPSKTRIEY